MVPVMPSTKPLLRFPFTVLALLLALAFVAAEIAMAVHAVRAHEARSALRCLLLLPMCVGMCLVAATALPQAVKRRLSRVYQWRIEPVMVLSGYCLFVTAMLAYGFK